MSLFVFDHLVVDDPSCIEVWTESACYLSIPWTLPAKAEATARHAK